MTLEDVKSMASDYLKPSEVAEVLHISPQEIRDRAKQCPETLGFRVVLSGKKSPHVKIPRAAFVAYMEGR